MARPPLASVQSDRFGLHPGRPGPLHRVHLSMQRSKAKDFDGVVIVEGIYSSKLLDARRYAKRTDEARRLLRVAITRARHTVVFVRPAGALPLTPPLPATGRAVLFSLRTALTVASTG